MENESVVHNEVQPEALKEMLVFSFKEVMRNLKQSFELANVDFELVVSEYLEELKREKK